MSKKEIDTLIFELDRLFPKEKNKKVIGLMKDKLSGKIMRKFAGLRGKTYSYLNDNNDEDKKKAKGTKKCLIKRKFKFQDYKNCLEVSQIENITNHSEKNKLMQIVLKKIKNNS